MLAMMAMDEQFALSRMQYPIHCYNRRGGHPIVADGEVDIRDAALFGIGHLWRCAVNADDCLDAFLFQCSKRAVTRRLAARIDACR